MGALLQEKAVRLCQELEEPPYLPRPLLGPLGPPADPVRPPERPTGTGATSRPRAGRAISIGHKAAAARSDWPRGASLRVMDGVGWGGASGPGRGGEAEG